MTAEDIKLSIYQHISGMRCSNIYCKGGIILVGVVSDEEQHVALFCSVCRLKIALDLVILRLPEED